ncbi:uncharacterized protein LOC108893229 [Lates calcarifer]|uniref:Uncharacterized protein LOC108893229 n=1 Tax=Lates calcarifer TaxID=8187 RepID=A0AAJ7VCJ2_LATCA|nr:uncharacterized protein LOC108893229 [Lates calcarifer]
MHTRPYSSGILNRDHQQYTNMNGLLPLLYCIGILGALLCGVQGNVQVNTGEDNSDSQTPQMHSAESRLQENNTAASTPTAAGGVNSSASTETADTRSSSTSPSSGPYHPATPATTATTATPATTATTASSLAVFYRKEWFTVLMVAGGLIIACVILLLCTLMLACKVCQLSRRLKMLSSSADLISGSEYWVGMAKKNKDKSETEAKETSMLMADLNQTKEAETDSTTKEEEGKVKEDGQTEEENKKEVGAAANSEEASADANKNETPVENSSSSKPQDDDADSQPTEAVAAPSSEGTGEPKDAV